MIVSGVGKDVGVGLDVIVGDAPGVAVTVTSVGKAVVGSGVWVKVETVVGAEVGETGTVWEEGIVVGTIVG